MATAGGDLQTYIGEFANDSAANAFFSGGTFNQARGYLYYDTTLSALKIWDGASWLNLTGGLVASLWTDGGGYLYPASGEDVVIGDTAMSGSEIFRVAGDALIDGGTLGLRGAPSSSIVLNVDDDLSLTAGTAGIFIQGSAAVTGTKASWQGAVSRLSLLTAGTITDVVGFDADLSMAVAAGTLTEAAGFHSDVSIGFAGASIGTYRGVHLENTSSIGTVTTAYGIDIGDQDQSSTTVYGLRIRDQGGTTSYGIYQDGTDDLNVLLGDVVIGDTSMEDDEHLLVRNTEPSGTPSGVRIDLDSAGSLTSWTGLIVDATLNDVGHTVTTGTQILCDSPSGTGTITTSFGIDIEDMSQNSTTAYGVRIKDQSATNSYGIYQEGADDENYFAGDVVVGSTSGLGGSSHLHVVSTDFSGSVNGIRAELDTGNSDTLATYNAILIDGDISSGQTVTNYRGILINSPIVSGTLTNAYGVFIAGQEGGTLSYGIYQSGASDENYFAGKVGIGTATLTEGVLVVEDDNDSTTQSGVEVKLNKTGSGALTTWRGVEVDPYVNAGTVGTMNCLAIAQPTGSGAINTIRGLLIPSLKAGPAASGTAFGILQQGAGDVNQFTGNTGVGAAAQADAQLYVQGDYDSNISTAMAVDALLDVGGSTTSITTGIGIASGLNVASGCTVVQGSAFFLRSPTGTGTINNAYALYIEDQDTGPATTGYGIYQAGSTTLNYFGGVIGTKNTTPSNSYGIDDDGGINTSDAFYVDGTQVVGSQQSAIANVTLVGSDQDGTARGKINDILAALRAHGLIDT